MLDYREAEAKLIHARTGREMERRKIQNNTYLVRLDEDTIGLLLHRTYIATYHRDSSVVLDSGGWRTYTTKDRLNGWVRGWTLFSGRHHRRAETSWWMVPRGRSAWAQPEGWVPFFDDIHVHQDTGAVLSPDEELVREMESRDPGPTKSDKVKEYLTMLTDPEQMAKIAAQPTRRYRPLNEREMARFMLESQYIDMSVIYTALRIDAAKRGELHRSPEQETLEWLDMMAEGREPPRIRSIIRNAINYLEKC